MTRAATVRRWCVMGARGDANREGRGAALPAHISAELRVRVVPVVVRNGDRPGPVALPDAGGIRERGGDGVGAAWLEPAGALRARRPVGRDGAVAGLGRRGLRVVRIAGERRVLVGDGDVVTGVAGTVGFGVLG